MPNMRKGSSFEREICKKLSLWWTRDLEHPRDDVFWRSSQSGGRATERAKKGKSTYGSYGDITAVDPIGEPLLKLFTIELKRGRSHGCPGDLLDASPSKVVRPFEATLNQTITSSERAGSVSWLLISKHDHRLPVVYLDYGIARWFPTLAMLSNGTNPPCARYSLLVNRGWGRLPLKYLFFVVRLESFLDRLDPKDVIRFIGKPLNHKGI